MWHKIFFNVQSVQSETDKAVLIKMPNCSEYAGFAFWHPRKLVREQGGKGYHYTFSFTDDFQFVIKKYGAGKYNRLDVIREETLSVEQMKEAFGVVDEHVNDFVEMETDRINQANEVHVTVTKHVPEKMEIKSIDIEPELLK